MAGPGKRISQFHKQETIFVEGELAGSVYYVQRGWVQLSASSRTGKSATVALHNRGDFVGQGCLAISQPPRLTTAIAFSSCTLLRIERREMLRALKQEPSLAGVFLSFLINRCTVLQAGLVDHVFNSSEKRLARILLLLGLDHPEGETIPYVTHETLAEMVGTTRSRISFFMNRFRKCGYVEYAGSLKVHRGFHKYLWLSLR
jgi:CRP-like cAMP-binding protein